MRDEVVVTDGVPVTCPFAVLKLRPSGSAGEIEYLSVPKPPLPVTGVKGVTVMPEVSFLVVGIVAVSA